MKTFHIIPVAAVLLLAACAKELPFSSSEGEKPRINVTLSFPTKSSSSIPVVNSVRILAFDGNAVCALNELKTSGISPVEVSDGYTIALGEFELESSTSANYDLYAVINEEGQVLQGTSSTLSGLMDANIAVGERSLNLFQSYFNTPAHYEETEVPAEEPAFLMSAVASYTMTEGDSKVPAEVEFNVAKRSLAQVTINSITSQPASVEDDYSSTVIPKVFVLGVSLENVPSAAAWGLVSGTLKENPTSIAVGEANTDGYYDRIWSGTISQVVTVNTIKREMTNARYWRTDKDSNTGWAFGSPSFVYQPDKIDAKDADKKAFEAAIAGPGKINEKYEGQIITLAETDLPGVFSNSSNISGVSYEVESLDSQGVSSPSDGYWTVSLGKSFYIPENIATTTGNETYIKVILAISSPSLVLDSMTPADYPVPTSIKETDSDLTWTYCIKDYNIADASSKITYEGTANKDKWIKQAFIDNGHVLASDASFFQGEEVNSQNGSKYYLAYVDGFTRRATGTADVTVENTTPGIGLNWNIPTSGENVYEFRIPVNNHVFDDDYSVRRNTKYSVTLHVTNETSFTKSGLGAGIGITAAVTTEKIDDYED